MKQTLVVCAVAGTMLSLATESFAQGHSGKSNGGPTIPLATFSVSPTKVKEKKPLTVTIVGTNPFSTTPSGSVIDAVIVPMIFNIGGTVFDPAAPNSCDSGISAVNRFNWSPLVQPVPNLTFNGVNVGTVQYTDGFMRAQFWNATGGSPAYTNPINWSTAAPIAVTATSSDGITYGTGCNVIGVVTQTLLNSQITSALQTLTQSGVISPAKFVLFLTEDVVGSSASPPAPPGTSGCCNWGYHSAAGSPTQFYAFADYGAQYTGSAGVSGNILVASHEVAEFMNDPLVNNRTPAWGGIGSISGCSTVLEVGDPLSHPQNGVPITMNGLTYLPQELAYFSWFFNAPSTPSLGAGGVFSSNGTLKGPSQPCPPGGTY